MAETLAIRTLIVDDEPLARRGVRQLLAPYPDFVVVGECRDGREALSALAALAPDLVFLDVQMPGLDGLAVVRAHGPERMPAVVFVTAYDEFAVRAFEAQALDYLVKPLGEARFAATIARVRERMRTTGALALAARLGALLAGTAAAPLVGSGEASGGHAGGRRAEAPGGRGGGRAAGRIAVRLESGELLLDPGEIDWIEADGDHAAIHAGGRRFRVRESLAALEARLDPARFARVHRRAVVRLDEVRELEHDAGAAAASLRLRGGAEVPVSRRRLARLRSLLRGAAGRS
jgi:two-component system LytT family response regulator